MIKFCIVVSLLIVGLSVTVTYGAIKDYKDVLFTLTEKDEDNYGKVLADMGVSEQTIDILKQSVPTVILQVHGDEEYTLTWKGDGVETPERFTLGTEKECHHFGITWKSTFTVEGENILKDTRTLTANGKIMTVTWTFENENTVKCNVKCNVKSDSNECNRVYAVVQEESVRPLQLRSFMDKPYKMSSGNGEDLTSILRTVAEENLAKLLGECTPTIKIVEIGGKYQFLWEGCLGSVHDEPIEFDKYLNTNKFGPQVKSYWEETDATTLTNTVDAKLKFTWKFNGDQITCRVLAIETEREIEQKYELVTSTEEGKEGKDGGETKSEGTGNENGTEGEVNKEGAEGKDPTAGKVETEGGKDDGEKKSGGTGEEKGTEGEVETGKEETEKGKDDGEKKSGGTGEEKGTEGEVKTGREETKEGPGANPAEHEEGGGDHHPGGGQDDDDHEEGDPEPEADGDE